MWIFQEIRVRTLQLPRLKTSVALKWVLLQTIDALSEGEWQDWVKEQLKHKPDDVGRAMYLRIKAHNAQALLTNESEKEHG